MRAAAALLLATSALAAVAGCSRPTLPTSAERAPSTSSKESYAASVATSARPGLVLAAALASPPTMHAAPDPTLAAPPGMLAASGPTLAAPPVMLATSEPTARTPAGASLAGKTVLQVGDSMVGGHGGLSRALRAKLESEGAKFHRDYKVSESLASFDRSAKLDGLLARHSPDIVIVTLGTNDALVPFPRALASHVRSIVKRVGARECYWIGPPLWKPDTGIVGVIRDNAGSCTFYDSSHLELQRISDGIHPTDKGGADWAEAFWTFMRDSIGRGVATSSRRGDPPALRAR